jgi:hypothetical protein
MTDPLAIDPKPLTDAADNAALTNSNTPPAGSPAVVRTAAQQREADFLASDAKWGAFIAANGGGVPPTTAQAVEVISKGAVSLAPPPDLRPEAPTLQVIGDYNRMGLANLGLFAGYPAAQVQKWAGSEPEWWYGLNDYTTRTQAIMDTFNVSTTQHVAGGVIASILSSGAAPAAAAITATRLGATALTTVKVSAMMAGASQAAAAGQSAYNFRSQRGEQMTPADSAWAALTGVVTSASGIWSGATGLASVAAKPGMAPVIRSAAIGGGEEGVVDTIESGGIRDQEFDITQAAIAVGVGSSIDLAFNAHNIFESAVRPAIDRAGKAAMAVQNAQNLAQMAGNLQGMTDESRSVLLNALPKRPDGTDQVMYFTQDDWNTKWGAGTGGDPQAEMQRFQGATSVEGMIAIPLRELLARYVNTPHYAELAEFARITPDAPNNGEAASVMSESQKIVDEAVANATGPKLADGLTNDDSDQIIADVREMGKSADLKGQVGSAVGNQAVITAYQFRALAESINADLGQRITPKQLWDMYAPKVARGSSEKRGGYDTDTRTITLGRGFRAGERADASTVVHEFSHHYFDVLSLISKDEKFAGISPELTIQNTELATWLKQNAAQVASGYKKRATKGGENLTAKAIQDNASRLHALHDDDYHAWAAMHEYIARGWEAYIQEGKAPTKGLEKVFAKFSEWISKVYGFIRGGTWSSNPAMLDVTLTPEIRTFFDSTLEANKALTRRSGVDSADFHAMLNEARKEFPIPDHRYQQIMTDTSDARAEAVAKIRSRLQSEKSVQITKDIATGLELAEAEYNALTPQEKESEDLDSWLARVHPELEDMSLSRESEMDDYAEREIQNYATEIIASERAIIAAAYTSEMQKADENREKFASLRDKISTQRKDATARLDLFREEASKRIRDAKDTGQLKLMFERDKQRAEKQEQRANARGFRDWLNAQDEKAISDLAEDRFTAPGARITEASAINKADAAQRRVIDAAAKGDWERAAEQAIEHLIWRDAAEIAQDVASTTRDTKQEAKIQGIKERAAARLADVVADSKARLDLFKEDIRSKANARKADVSAMLELIKQETKASDAIADTAAVRLAIMKDAPDAGQFDTAAKDATNEAIAAAARGDFDAAVDAAINAAISRTASKMLDANKYAELNQRFKDMKEAIREADAVAKVQAKMHSVTKLEADKMAAREAFVAEGVPLMNIRPGTLNGVAMRLHRDSIDAFRKKEYDKALEMTYGIQRVAARQAAERAVAKRADTARKTIDRFRRPQIHEELRTGASIAAIGGGRVAFFQTTDEAIGYLQRNPDATLTDAVSLVDGVIASFDAANKPGPNNAPSDIQRGHIRALELYAEQLELIYQGVIKANELYKNVMGLEMRAQARGLNESTKAHAPNAPIDQSMVGKVWYGWVAASVSKMGEYAIQLDGGHSGNWNDLADKVRLADGKSRQLFDAETAKVLEVGKRTGMIDYVAGVKNRANIATPAAHGVSLSRIERAMLAAHWGSETGRERMISSLMVKHAIDRAKAEQVAASVLNNLDEGHVEFINALWAQNESLKPAVEDTYRSIGEAPPRWIAAAPFQVNGGTITLRGGYVTVKYDNEVPRTSEDMWKDLVGQDNYVKRSLQPSEDFTKNRVAADPKRAVRLDLDVHFEHLREVADVIAKKPLAMQVNRLFHESRGVFETVAETYGPHYMIGAQGAFRNAITGPPPPTTTGDRWLAHIRANTSVATLGVNLATIAKQPLGLLSSFSHPAIKSLDLVGAIGRFTTHPREMYRFMKDKSKIGDMFTIGTQHAQDIQQSATGTPLVEGIKRWSMTPISFTQMAATVPTWHAAYTKGMRDFQNEAKAILFADRVVRESQGSGETTEMTALHQDQKTRLLTTFGGFLITQFNRGNTALLNARKDPAQWRHVGSVILLNLFMGAAANELVDAWLKDGEFGAEDKASAASWGYWTGKTLVDSTLATHPASRWIWDSVQRR